MLIKARRHVRQFKFLATINNQDISIKKLLIMADPKLTWSMITIEDMNPQIDNNLLFPLILAKIQELSHNTNLLTTVLEALIITILEMFLRNRFHSNKEFKRLIIMKKFIMQSAQISLQDINLKIFLRLKKTISSQDALEKERKVLFMNLTKRPLHSVDVFY